MGCKQTVAPTAQAVTISEAALHCRCEEDADLSKLGDFIRGATEYVESQTNRQLMTATYQYTLDRFPFSDAGGVCQDMPILLPWSPLQSVTSIAYIDSSGTTQTLGASTYIVDDSRDPARIVPAYSQTWPFTQSRINAVTVTFVAGYTSQIAVPYALKAAIMLLVGNWMENREATISGTIIAKVPYAVESLLWTYKVPVFI